MSAQSSAPARPAGDRRVSSSIKRQSVLPKPSSLVLDPSVLVAQHAQFAGTHPITIGPNTILHPHTRISSAVAPVVLGEGVIVYEKAKIGVGTGDSMNADSRRSSVMSAVSTRDSLRGDGTVLGRNVVVETFAVVEAAEVGEGSVIEVGAVVGRGCVIGRVRPNLPCNHHYNTHVICSTAPSAQQPYFLRTHISPIILWSTAEQKRGSIRLSSHALRFYMER
jgi:dynactin-6